MRSITPATYELSTLIVFHTIFINYGRLLLTFSGISLIIVGTVMELLPIMPCLTIQWTTRWNIVFSLPGSSRSSSYSISDFPSFWRRVPCWKPALWNRAAPKTGRTRRFRISGEQCRPIAARPSSQVSETQTSLFNPRFRSSTFHLWISFFLQHFLFTTQPQLAWDRHCSLCRLPHRKISPSLHPLSVFNVSSVLL